MFVSIQINGPSLLETDSFGQARFYFWVTRNSKRNLPKLLLFGLIISVIIFDSVRTSTVTTLKYLSFNTS